MALRYLGVIKAVTGNVRGNVAFLKITGSNKEQGPHMGAFDRMVISILFLQHPSVNSFKPFLLSRNRRQLYGQFKL